MCRMIGVVSSREVSLRPFFDALVEQALEGKVIGEKHGDGYGIAVLRNGHWLHVREQCPIWEAPGEQLGSLAGNILILHARLASDHSTINISKLHPFCWPGEQPGIMFCQNGTIREHQRLKSNLPPDAIDTERYFDVVIRHYLDSRDLESAQLAAAEEIYSSGIDARSINALLSDGQRLIAYRGRVLPEYRDYHTLFVSQSEDSFVVSTQEFDLPRASSWRGLAEREIVSSDTRLTIAAARTPAFRG